MDRTCCRGLWAGLCCVYKQPQYPRGLWECRFVLVRYLWCVNSVFLTVPPTYSLSGTCTALEPQQREARGATSMTYAYTSLPPGTHTAA